MFKYNCKDLFKIRRPTFSEDISQQQLLNMTKIVQLSLFHQIYRAIFFRAVSARKNQQLAKQDFLRASQSAEIDILVISRVTSDICLSLQFYPITLPLEISLKRKTYRDVKGKILFSYWNQYYQSHSVTSTKAAKILFEK